MTTRSTCRLPVGVASSKPENLVTSLVMSWWRFAPYSWIGWHQLKQSNRLDLQCNAFLSSLLITLMNRSRNWVQQFPSFLDCEVWTCAVSRRTLNFADELGRTVDARLMWVCRRYVCRSNWENMISFVTHFRVFFAFSCWLCVTDCQSKSAEFLVGCLLWDSPWAFEEVLLTEPLRNGEWNLNLWRGELGSQHQNWSSGQRGLLSLGCRSVLFIFHSVADPAPFHNLRRSDGNVCLYCPVSSSLVVRRPMGLSMRGFLSRRKPAREIQKWWLCSNVLYHHPFRHLHSDWTEGLLLDTQKRRLDSLFSSGMWVPDFAVNFHWLDRLWRTCLGTLINYTFLRRNFRIW